MLNCLSEIHRQSMPILNQVDAGDADRQAPNNSPAAPKVNSRCSDRRHESLHVLLADDNNALAMPC